MGFTNVIQHIVLWNFLDGIDQDATFNELERDFAAFAPKVPGMSSLKLYRGFAGYHVCLISLHQDRAALAAYQQFPDHLVIKEKIAAVRKDRASCDFEL